MIRMVDHGLQALLSGIYRHRILSAAEERELIRRTQQEGDRQAHRYLCDCNLKFVVTVANRFQGNGLAVDELIKEGTIGLYVAVERFDLARQYKFVSYAVWWIRAKIIRAIDEQGRMLHISPDQARAMAKLRSAPLRQFLGGETHIPDEALAGMPAYMREAVNAAAPCSLDAPMNEHGDTQAVFMTSPEPSPEEMAVKAESKGVTRALLATLEPRDRRIVRLLFGLESGEAMTLEQVGDLYGLSKERVRQIRNGAVAQMRKKAGKYGG